MCKKIVVAGCRYYDNYTEAKFFIEKCLLEIGNENDFIFVSGGCKGADQLAERFAKEKDFTIKRFLPKWKEYGRAAGPKRNMEMAEFGDLIICFWDNKSKGTKSMIECAKKLNKPIKIMFIE